MKNTITILLLAMTCTKSTQAKEPPCYSDQVNGCNFSIMEKPVGSTFSSVDRDDIQITIGDEMGDRIRALLDRDKNTIFEIPDGKSLVITAIPNRKTDIIGFQLINGCEGKQEFVQSMKIETRLFSGDQETSEPPVYITLPPEYRNYYIYTGSGIKNFDKRAIITIRILSVHGNKACISDIFL